MPGRQLSAFGRLATVAEALFRLAGKPQAAKAQTDLPVPSSVGPYKFDPESYGVNHITGKMAIGQPLLAVPGAPRLRFDGSNIP